MKTAFLFPGQGVQYIGMGVELYTQYQLVKDLFDRASEIMKKNLAKLCFEGSLTELTISENAQPAILTVGVGAFQVLLAEGKAEPAFLAGNSLGELTALTCSGALAFDDAIRLVQLRGRYMKAAVNDEKGGMIAVQGIHPDIVHDACQSISVKGHYVTISNYNTSNQTVVSGTVRGVQEAEKVLQRNGAKINALNTKIPFHSRMMKPAVEKMTQFIDSLYFEAFSWPVLSNVTALPYLSRESIKPLLLAQMQNAVRWKECMEYLVSQNIEMYFDMGPKSIIKNLFNEEYRAIRVQAYDKN